MRRGEISFAVVIILVLASAFGLDRFISARPGAAGPGTTTAALPPESQAWYCPTPASRGLGSSVGTGNLGQASTLLRRSNLGAAGAAPVTATLGPGAFTSAAVAPSPPGAAAVESFGQPVASFLTVIAPNLGGATSRCTLQPGARWLFATASTAPGYNTYLLVANPFHEQAIISVRVLTPTGDQVPAGLGDVSVPPASQSTIFLGDYYPETTSFGLDVTASRGRVVAARLMQVSQAGVRGVALDLGSPQPSTQWIFPGGAVPAQGEEDIVVANPSSHEALISELFQIASGDAPPGKQNIPIPAGTQVTLKISGQVPASTAHGTTIVSTNGVPVVAERVTTQGSGTTQGYEIVAGAPAGARRWVVPAGSSASGTDTLGVVSTGSSAATFSVTVLAPSGPDSPAALAGLHVAAGDLASVDLTPYLNGQSAMAVVQATSGTIAVENDDALPANYQETMETAGIPLG